jgi:hypothetical protein
VFRFLVVSFFVLPSISLSDCHYKSFRDLRDNQVSASSLARKISNFRAVVSTTPSQDTKSLFGTWILDQINNDSVMRDQIGEEIQKIEFSGRAQNLSIFLTRTGDSCSRLQFMDKDLNLKSVGDKGAIKLFRASLDAYEGYPGQHTITRFVFSFGGTLPHVEESHYFPAVVVEYPLLQSTEKIYCSGKVCSPSL